MAMATQITYAPAGARSRGRWFFGLIVFAIVVALALIFTSRRVIALAKPNGSSVSIPAVQKNNTAPTGNISSPVNELPVPNTSMNPDMIRIPGASSTSFNTGTPSDTTPQDRMNNHTTNPQDPTLPTHPLAPAPHGAAAVPSQTQ